MNQSGRPVNIAQVLAAYYDNSGKVIWVSDGYVDQALMPQVPVPFAVDIPDDIAATVEELSRHRQSLLAVEQLDHAERTPRSNFALCTLPGSIGLAVRVVWLGKGR